MKIAVVGTRTFKNKELLEYWLSKFANRGDIIVSGGASGADTLAEDYADETDGLDKEIHEAQWEDFSEPCLKRVNKQGKTYNALAGFKRNTKIAESCDILLAFWDGESKGTKDTIDKVINLNKPYIIIQYANI